MGRCQEGLQMVAGRFVNVYKSNDGTLGIIFRARVLSRDWLEFNLLNFKGLRVLTQLNLWRDTVLIF
ncbi:hypothetical protein V6N13_065721 [Hibiscus sabdariffa]|uniref:Uncharacterized protein n=1 Tax=Hibiscus sabdariffa TaxID=183260 RepID=A0ABR2QPZ5_9ROSI